MSNRGAIGYWKVGGCNGGTSEAVAAALKAAVGHVYARQPLAFYEEPDEERARLELFRREDPISYQDAVNTSRALVDAVRDGDHDEMCRVIADAEPGELLQPFIIQAFVIAVNGAMLEIVRVMVDKGIPLQHEYLSQSLHLVCEVATRENFGSVWRIVQLLIEGNNEGRVNLDSPRYPDGWTPLCIACAQGCLPLAFKLLDFKADPNVITRNNDTPIALAKKKRSHDGEEQKEARGIIVNMLREYGGKESYKDALKASRLPRKKPPCTSLDEPQPNSQLTTTAVGGGYSGGGAGLDGGGEVPQLVTKGSTAGAPAEQAKEAPQGVQEEADGGSGDAKQKRLIVITKKPVSKTHTRFSA
eukprot:TRINITY_DN61874_c0_g1_i1.p1 TRINITY_DN61874_c0_g1~~TRINITY_DN61874_c0_g1_i1.p1  ORF type:complete len:358 (-),score=77.00 TRINITY_DN61874_c0_g1_i1:151-1224(-)